MEDEDKLIPEDEVRKLVPYSPSQIWRNEQRGKFPRRIKLAEGQGGRVAWSLREVREWIAARKAERDQSAAS